MKNRIHFSFLIISWTIVVVCSILWNSHVIGNNALTIARSTGSSFFKEIQITRLWNTQHGGVYVPITETTQPNPYLKTPNRDVVTYSGLQLTKINPSFMTRQVAEIAEVENNIKYHITSLNPIRPANKADEWETLALNRFESGEQEILEFFENAQVYRYMAPLTTQESCLVCHAEQGYEIGDIRGGISVTIPAEPYLVAARSSRSNMIMFHIVALALGVLILSVFNKFRTSQEKKIEETNRELAFRIAENEETGKVLEKSFHELSSAMDASEDVIYLLDLNRKLLKANQAFYKMIKSSPDNVLGKHIADILHPNSEKAAREVCRAQENHTDMTTVMEAGHPDNPAGKPVEVKVKIVRDLEGKPLSIYVCIHDLTSTRKELEEKRLLEGQLRQAHKMEAIGTLAGGIAHDFNNLLTPIIGYAELAKNEEISQHGQMAENIEEILRAGYRAKDLVRNILSFSRKAEQEMKPLNLHPIFSEAVKLMRASIPSTIEIKQDLNKFCGNILADPSQIHQVLINLCTNSAQSMNEGGVLEVSMRSCKLDDNDLENEPDVKPGEFIEIIVKDTGEGIEREIIDRMFEPYYTTKEAGKGSGMGLAIVHGIVKSHNGFVMVNSTIGVGSSFHVYLPIIDANESLDPEEVEPLPMGNEHILVVDDDESVAELNTRMLEWLGYEVTKKTDSTEALETFRSQPEMYDLVMTDQTMPKLTGKDLTQEVISIKPDIPVIICTGFSENLNKKSALEAGAKAFLIKPLEHHDLAHTVRELLDGT